MDENTKTTFGKTIPEDIRMVILSADTKQKFTGIMNKYSLRDNQSGNLEIETNLVMIGLEHPLKFIGNIAKALNVPEEKARAIAEDINTEIFRPVRESLRKIHGIREEEVGSGKPPIPTPIVPKPPIPVPPAPVVPEPLPTPQLVPLPPTPPLPPTMEPEEKPPSREEILRDIENPVPTKPTSNIVQDKLSGMVRMPKSVEEIKEPPPYVADPYREPLK
ncbi:MAG: hypothetical protein WC673_01985 [Candidatus Paceibacterota bacterium]|jgi:hypothetical protein